MATTQIPTQRIRALNDQPLNDDRDYVLYWMQASMRAEHNHALELAVQRANTLGKRLLVGFGIMDDYPEANLRHYKFMVQGLVDVEKTLKQRNIKFVVQHGHPADVAISLGKQAAEIVTDCGYLRFQREWRQRVADEANVRVTQVETDAVVPVEEVTDKAEHAARTIRPKITDLQGEYLVELRTTSIEKDSLNLPIDGMDLSNVDKVLDSLKLDRSLAPVDWLFTGGTKAAKSVLESFLDDSFDSYAEHRNQPQTNDVSHMSMYLHFGQISPVQLAMTIRDTPAGQKDDRSGFLEEMIVRRELSLNLCNFDDTYDSFDGLPDWAQETLDDHRKDKREHVYSREELENAQTHDDYWNAAQREMRYTGYMHNYMRMYWGKKVLEWTETPENAYENLLAINNKYFMDGRDPNSYANVAWIFGRHDRGWTERPVFGKVRYMNANGLKRKCKPDQYVKKVDKLVEQAKEHGAE